LGVPAEALADLEAFFRHVDEEVRGLGSGCQRCGRCCDFARNDYRLYASGLERALVASRYGEPRLGGDGRCCFQSGRLCDPSAKRAGETLAERFIAELRALSRRHRVPWDYAPFFSSERDA